MEGPLAVGSAAQVEARVVGSPMMVTAEREEVVEIGAPAARPRQPVVVDLAPGERSLTTGHGARVVKKGQGAPLGARVQSSRTAQVDRLRLAAEDSGDQPRVTGQAPSLAGGDRDPGVESGRAEAGEQRVELHRDQHLE